MTNSLNYASCQTPKVSTCWAEKAEALRKKEVEAALMVSNVQFLKDFRILSCKDDGQIIVEIHSVMGPAERGTKLLDLEEALKNKVDEGITVWAESLGDKNSLRNLRGIEVK